MTEDLTTFEGRVYSITGAPSDPKPIQSPLPLLVGTASPRMLRITARHADEWNTWGHLDEARLRRDAFEAACAAVGRDPRGMHTSVQALVYLDASPDLAERVMSGPFGDRSIAGPPGAIVDAIGRYAEMGFDEFIVPTFNLGPDPTQRREAIERIDQEVIRQLVVRRL
jgi:alkanesulfonate monooxygenase SsuD/methylene tetrahydromethanopterin reductase-like flavin-dependent oxidoreductase (luciferase family)